MHLFSEATTAMLLTPEKVRIITGNEDADFPGTDKLLSEKLMRRHASWEIMVVLAGEYVYYLNRHFYLASPGTIFLIDGNIDHEYFYSLDADKLRHLWFFGGNGFQKLLAQYIKVDNGVYDTVERISLDYPVKNLRMKWAVLSENSTLDLKEEMIHLIRCTIEYMKSNCSDNIMYQRNIVRMTKRRIKQSLRHGMSLDHIARLGGYSKFHFTKIFKEYTGFTVLEYVNLCRIDKYKKLRRKQMRKKEIAYELGFSSLSSFCNWMKKQEL